LVPGSNTVASGPARGVRYLRRRAARLTAQIGDEGAMVARRLPDVPLVFCRDKRRALDVAVDSCSPTHAVLDDAFQSWGVPRDVDIVLVDGDRPFGDGWLLPAGRLREPPEALERSDFVGVNGVENDVQLENAGKAMTSLGIRKPLFGIRRRIVIEPVDAGVSSDIHATSAALCAIGRAEAFERQVSAGLSGIAASFRFPDHYRYDRRDMEWILGEADRRGIGQLVTTEKDWVKLSELDPPLGRFSVARLELGLFGADPVPQIQKAAD
jgi:tetraacyldisaccharide 4'-kinase